MKARVVYSEGEHPVREGKLRCYHPPMENWKKQIALNPGEFKVVSDRREVGELEVEIPGAPDPEECRFLADFGDPFPSCHNLRGGLVREGAYSQSLLCAFCHLRGWGFERRSWRKRYWVDPQGYSLLIPELDEHEAGECRPEVWIRREDGEISFSEE